MGGRDVDAFGAFGMGGRDVDAFGAFWLEVPGTLCTESINVPYLRP